MNEMQEFFHRTPRQDRNARILEWGIYGIIAGMVITMAVVTWFFPFR